MKARALRRYRHPKYPTRQQAITNPNLLRQHMPAPWKTIPEMAGAVALFLAVNAGSVRAWEKPGVDGKSMAIVAPIFDHGDGRGAIACIAVAPPVFLSEEEALQIIVEELGKKGVETTEQWVEVSGVTVPLTNANFLPSNHLQVRSQQPAKPLDALLLKTKKTVAIQVITRRNYDKLGGPQYDNNLVIQYYDTKSLAKSLAETVKQQAKEPLYMGIFYDPLVRVEPPVRPPRESITSADSGNMNGVVRRNYTPDVEEHINPADLKKPFERECRQKKQSEWLLRQQVQDFLAWLQGQGVI